MKHSAITNPDDLHYAKIRAFAGNASAVAPDFVDQLLVSTDNNKIYRANGTIAGDLVDLSTSTPPQSTNTPKVWTVLPNPNFQGQEQQLETGNSYVRLTSYAYNLNCRLTGDVNKQIEVSPNEGVITLILKSGTSLRVRGTRIPSWEINGDFDDGTKFLVLPQWTYFSAVLAFDPILNEEAFIVLQGTLQSVSEQNNDQPIVFTTYTA